MSRTEVYLPAAVYVSVITGEGEDRIDRIAILPSQDDVVSIWEEEDEDAGDEALEYVNSHAWEPLLALGDSEPDPRFVPPPGEEIHYRRNSDLAADLDRVAEDGGASREQLADLLKEAARRLRLVSRISWEG